MVVSKKTVHKLCVCKCISVCVCVCFSVCVCGLSFVLFSLSFQFVQNLDTFSAKKYVLCVYVLPHIFFFTFYTAIKKEKEM